MYNTDDAIFNVSNSEIMFLEHVIVTLTLEVHTTYGREYDYDDFYGELTYADDLDEVYDWLRDPHPRRGDVEIELRSPSGTTSVLLPYRDYDFVNDVGYDSWPFMSVHFWGENPVGTWTLRTTYKSGSGHITISDVALTMYGTGRTPLSIESIPSTCHSSCKRGCSGQGADRCDVCKNFRVASTLECVDECPSGTQAYKQYCITGSVSDDTNVCDVKGQSSILITAIVCVVAVVLIFLVTIAIVVSVYMYKRGRKQNSFRRLYNATNTITL